MNTLIKIFVLFLFMGISVNCSADGKKYWKEKLERYEQAKKETIQKGETWDPSKFDTLEKEKRERANEEGWGPIILVIFGLFIFIVVSYFLADFLSKATKTENSEMSGCWGVVAMAILIALIALVVNFKGCKNSSPYKSDYPEYWDNARMHPDRN